MPLGTNCVMVHNEHHTMSMLIVFLQVILVIFLMMILVIPDEIGGESLKEEKYSSLGKVLNGKVSIDGRLLKPMSF